MSDEQKPAKEKAEKAPKSEAQEKAIKAAKAAKADKKLQLAPATEAAPLPKGYIPRLRKSYRDEIAPALLKEKKYSNIMAVPRLSKVSINMGIGEAKGEVKVLDEATYILTAITAQKPALRRSKKSIANFKLRKGMIVGLHVTLRGT